MLPVADETKAQGCAETRRDASGSEADAYVSNGRAFRKRLIIVFSEVDAKTGTASSAERSSSRVNCKAMHILVRQPKKH